MATKTENKEVAAKTAVDDKEVKQDEVKDQEVKQDENYGTAAPVNSAGEAVEVTPATHAYQVEAGWSGLDKENAAAQGADKNDKLVTGIEAFIKKLEGKGVQELMVLREKALQEEVAAKREITILRQRAANMASTAETDVEEGIILAKKELANAMNWLQAIEQKLSGKL